MVLPKPKGCEGCPLQGDHGPTLAQGNQQEAKLIYIVEGPSGQDAQQGSLLSDSSGRVLNRQLMEAGLQRSQLFITSLVKCYSPHSHKVAAAQAHCRKYLDAELRACKADTVLLAGQGAFSAFIGSYSTLLQAYKPTPNIHARRGCVEQKDGRKWIGVLHPRDHMANVKTRDETIEHLKKALRLSGAPLSVPKVHIGASDSTVMEAGEFIRHQVRAFADDVETHQMSTVSEDDYVGGDYEVDMAAVSLGRWQALTLSPDQLSLLIPLYTDKDVWCYEHNGMYDQYHISKLIGHGNMYADDTIHHRHNKWMDGMLAAHYHKSYKFKYLKPDCLSRYTDLPYYDRKIEQVDRHFYNGLDVIATHQECETLRCLLQGMRCWDLFLDIGMPILPLLEEERQYGVRCDLRKVYLYTRIFQAKVEKAHELAKALVGGLVDPFNPHTLKKLLYEMWALPKQYEDDRLTTNYEARKRLLAYIDDPGHPERQTTFKLAKMLITLVDYHSGERKKLEYLGRLSPDGKIHAYYKAHGERPFRLSSTPNLQNFPVYDVSDWGGARKTNKGGGDPLGFERPEESLGSLRSIVVADHDDDLILTIDFSQVQLWIYAEIAGCKWLRQVRDSKDYIYGIVYEELYKEPFFDGQGRQKENMLSSVPQQRIRRAKAVPLGFLFGRSAAAVAEEYGWSMEEANKLRKWWFDHCPELLDSYEQTKYDLKQKGYICQPYGNWMWFPEGKLTEAVNSRAQSTEAFIVMESKILIDRAFKQRGWRRTRLMLSVHDSISMNIHKGKTHPERVVEVYEGIVAPILSRPNKYLNGAVFPHEAEVSYMWDWETTKYPKWKARTFNSAQRIDRRTDQNGVALAEGQGV